MKDGREGGREGGRKAVSSDDDEQCVALVWLCWSKALACILCLVASKTKKQQAAPCSTVGGRESEGRREGG